MMRLLLVEDDRDVAEYIRKGLEEEGYTVKVCFDGASGLKAAEIAAFDIIVLDVMLPHMNGFEVTKRLKLQKIRTPILLLTARDAPQDVVQGLDAGADDYLTKPFSFDILLARIRARTRATEQTKSTTIRYADLMMDINKHEVWRGNRQLNLTRTEFSILECLLRTAGRVATRDRIVNVVWGERGASDNNLDVFMQFLRHKVDAQGSKKLIHTQRGFGYSLRDVE
jgi:DNA-binding response OmpR family regulator